jgi:hypothetical protein
MAFKMTPGRGNFAKTGHGVPSPFKQTDDAAAKIQRELNRRKNNIDTERTASTDSIAVRKRILDDPYFDKKSKMDQNIAGSMGGEAANAVRKKNPNNVYVQVEKDANTGKSKRVQHDRNLENLKAEYDKQQAKKPEDQGIKNPRKSSPVKQTKNQEINDKVTARLKQRKNAVDNERSAVSDSTAVSNKAFNSGYFDRKNSQDRNLIGNLSMEAANATRKKNPNNGYNQVEKDANTGKLRKVGYDRNLENAKKSSPAKQCFPTPQEKADNQKKNFENRKNGPSTPMAKDAMKERGSKYEPGKTANKEMQRVYKGSPAKQLGRQAVTKMGGKKTPVKMKSC